MTITIKRSTAVIAIALVGVLGGLALGQVTDAISSEDPPASASFVSPLERDVKKLGRQLGEIKAALGERGIIGDDVLDYLDDIRGNTYGTCQNTGGSAYCHN